MLDAADVAWGMGLVPLAWIPFTSKRRDARWGWLAGAFGVSFVADALALGLAKPDRWIPSLLYPVSQSAIVGLALLSLSEAASLLAVVVLLALAAIGVRAVYGPGIDVVLRAGAWGAVCWTVWPRRELGTLRTGLLVSFGVGLLGWLAFSLWQVVPMWYVYQSIRAIGIGLFCYAASTRPLSISRR